MKNIDAIDFVSPTQARAALSYSKASEFKRFAFNIQRYEPSMEWDFTRKFYRQAQDLDSKGSFRPRIVTRAIENMLEYSVHNAVLQCRYTKVDHTAGEEFLKYGLQQDLFSSSEKRQIIDALDHGYTLDRFANELNENYPERLTQNLLDYEPLDWSKYPSSSVDLCCDCCCGY